MKPCAGFKLWVSRIQAVPAPPSDKQRVLPLSKVAQNPISSSYGVRASLTLVSIKLRLVTVRRSQPIGQEYVLTLEILMG